MKAVFVAVVFLFFILLTGLSRGVEPLKNIIDSRTVNRIELNKDLKLIEPDINIIENKEGSFYKSNNFITTIDGPLVKTISSAIFLSYGDNNIGTLRAALLVTVILQTYCHPSLGNIKESIILKKFTHSLEINKSVQFNDGMCKIKIIPPDNKALIPSFVILATPR